MADSAPKNQNKAPCTQMKSCEAMRLLWLTARLRIKTKRLVLRCPVGLGDSALRTGPKCIWLTALHRCLLACLYVAGHIQMLKLLSETG